MDPPFVSVVIPTFNREADLGRCLEGWERQQPADLPFEVVVVDDGSSDGTAARLRGWGGRRFSLRSAHQANAGPAAARNRALELAAGELVLFTGDDIEPTPTLLAEHCQGHRERGDPAAAVLGLIRWPPGVALSATMRHVDGVGGSSSASAAWSTGTGTTSATSTPPTCRCGGSCSSASRTVSTRPSRPPPSRTRSSGGASPVTA